jgi:UDP-GlcNAc:undecaprenyl-phosphate GlcNAc-1-phosphate transferase
MYPLLKPFEAGIISLVSCLLIIPIIIKLAHKQGWKVSPRDDRWHKKPTALMGGVGIFIAFNIAFFAINKQFNWELHAAFCLMFLVGLVDDLREVKPVIKMLSQIVCSFVLIFNGLDFGGGLLGWAGIPLTFIWVIGITNAINLLDNMDGLASGISGIVAVITGILAVLKGDVQLAIIAFSIAGSAIGFLFYNFKPAKIFMGDSGSLFLGFALAYLSVSIQGKLGSSSGILVLLIPISLMAIPIMDTTLVTIKRLSAGRRIDQGGKDHTSHRLVALGLSEKKAVLILYFISAIWGVLCILMFKTQINNLFLCILLLAIFSVVFSIILSKVKVYNDSEQKLSYLRIKGKVMGDTLMFRFFLLHKKLLIGICTDILIIYSAFLVATKAMDVSTENQEVILATFICVKISVFYITNLYYRMWRYMEVLEVVGYFITICIATIILAVILFIKDKADVYTSYFYLIDFLLTFIGIVFSRLLYRSVSELINRNRFSEKKVIIYGAGDSGYLLIKELLQNHRHELRPIGWIDDDISKHNMLLYGYKIFGGISQLSEICEKSKPDMILISTSAINKESEATIKTILASQSISLGRFSISLNYDLA